MYVDAQLPLSVVSSVDSLVISTVDTTGSFVVVVPTANKNTKQNEELLGIYFYNCAI